MRFPKLPTQWPDIPQHMRAYLILGIGAFVAILISTMAMQDAEQASKDAEQASIKLERSTHNAIQATITAFRVNCEQDTRFRQQYKIRGKAEEKLLSLFVQFAQQDIEEGTGSDAAKNFIREFKPLLNRIEIIPLPDCEEQGRVLEEALKEFDEL